MIVAIYDANIDFIFKTDSFFYEKTSKKPILVDFLPNTSRKLLKTSF